MSRAPFLIQFAQLKHGFFLKIKGNHNLQGNAQVYNVRIPVEQKSSVACLGSGFQVLVNCALTEPSAGLPALRLSTSRLARWDARSDAGPGGRHGPAAQNWEAPQNTSKFSQQTEVPPPKVGKTHKRCPIQNGGLASCCLT